MNHTATESEDRGSTVTESGPAQPHKARGLLLIVSILTTTGALVWAVVTMFAIKEQKSQFEQMTSRIDELKKSFDTLEYRNVNRDSLNSVDVVGLEVGVIQFLKRGYSISFEQVQYSQDGLKLVGEIGNPFSMGLHTVTLNFSVRQPPDFEEFKKEEGWARVFYEPTEIGRAQSAPIPFVSPGSRSRFEVLVPNVKQTSNGVRVRLWFSGERYSYP